MVLVQILVPLYDDSGKRFPRGKYVALRRTLTDRFGGATIYSRAPAEGLWDEGDRVVRDDIVIFETMTTALDRQWWRKLRRRLEKSFRQDEVIIRASDCEML